MKALEHVSAGNAIAAIYVLHQILKMPNLEARHYLQALHFLKQMGPQTTALCSEISWSERWSGYRIPTDVGTTYAQLRLFSAIRFTLDSALFSANVGPPDLFVRMNAKPSRMSATVIFITYDIYCLSKVYFRTAIYEVLVCLQLKPSIWHHSFG